MPACSRMAPQRRPHRHPPRCRPHHRPSPRTGSTRARGTPRPAAASTDPRRAPSSSRSPPTRSAARTPRRARPRPRRDPRAPRTAAHPPTPRGSPPPRGGGPGRGGRPIEHRGQHVVHRRGLHRVGPRVVVPHDAAVDQHRLAVELDDERAMVVVRVDRALARQPATSLRSERPPASVRRLVACPVLGSASNVGTIVRGSGIVSGPNTRLSIPRCMYCR